MGSKSRLSQNIWEIEDIRQKDKGAAGDEKWMVLLPQMRAQVVSRQRKNGDSQFAVSVQALQRKNKHRNRATSLGARSLTRCGAIRSR